MVKIASIALVLHWYCIAILVPGIVLVLYCLKKASIVHPCSAQDGVGFPSLGIAERLIPAHLSMLHEKEEYYTHS